MCFESSIKNYVNTVQSDAQYIFNYVGQKNTSREQDGRVVRAALRCLYALGMASALINGVAVLAAGGGSLPLLLLAGLPFIFCHDVFVILSNGDKGICGQVVTVARGIFADLSDLWSGNKTLDSAVRHPHAEGTILRPIWDSMLPIWDSILC